jgi:hypothetical protein
MVASANLLTAKRLLEQEQQELSSREATLRKLISEHAAISRQLAQITLALQHLDVAPVLDIPSAPVEPTPAPAVVEEPMLPVFSGDARTAAYMELFTDENATFTRESRATWMAMSDDGHSPQYIASIAWQCIDGTAKHPSNDLVGKTIRKARIRAAANDAAKIANTTPPAPVTESSPPAPEDVKLPVDFLRKHIIFLGYSHALHYLLPLLMEMKARVTIWTHEPMGEIVKEIATWTKLGAKVETGMKITEVNCSTIGAAYVLASLNGDWKRNRFTGGTLYTCREVARLFADTDSGAKCLQWLDVQEEDN